jgi:hypothetical protein
LIIILLRYLFYLRFVFFHKIASSLSFFFLSSFFLIIFFLFQVFSINIFLLISPFEIKLTKNCASRLNLDKKLHGMHFLDIKPGLRDLLDLSFFFFKIDVFLFFIIFFTYFLLFFWFDFTRLALNNFFLLYLVSFFLIYK